MPSKYLSIHLLILKARYKQFRPDLFNYLFKSPSPLRPTPRVLRGSQTRPAMDQFVGFQPEPNCGRGTVGIIWNCLTTILLCTWTVLHSDSVGVTTLQKLGEFALVLVVPESLAGAALHDFFHALRHRNEIRKQGSGWEKWTIKQSFLARMGGLDAGFDARELPGLISQHRVIRDSFHLFPTDDLIDGRSKSDTTAKIIATLQAAWFAVSVLFRLATHTPLSLAEVLTVGYVACGLMTALLYFRMPQGISERFKITIPGLEATPKPRSTWSRWMAQQGVRITWIELWTLEVLVVAFTAIHLGAWNYEFPTAAEAIAWKTAAFASGTSALIIMALVNQSDENKEDPMWMTFLLLVAIMIYMLARLYIMSASFIAFRAAPVGIYLKPSWSSYAGHIGT